MIRAGRLRYLVAAAVGGIIAWVSWRLLPSAATPSAQAQVIAESELRSRDIQFYEERVRQDPLSAADFAQLAGLYLQRGRETGDTRDLVRAEDAAQRSLQLREPRNAKARLVLASSLLARHRFPEALEAARALCEAAPEQVSYCALLGEIQVEMGHYESARQTFTALSHARSNLAVAPRLARWAEILGATEQARRVLQAAFSEAEQRPDLPREQLAWFYLRVGDLELRNGRLREAAKVLREGLDLAPTDRRLLGAMAKLEAVRHRWKKAIRYGERSAAIAPDPVILGLVGDAYAALGDRVTAEHYFAEVERTAAENPEPFNRGWTQFRLDHDRHLPETLELLQREITLRRDVYGYDQLAWALYQCGQYQSAREAMLGALRMSTRDATLYFHAGMIEAALGSRESAVRHLKTALGINPYFHHAWPEVARAVLASLEASALQTSSSQNSTLEGAPLP